jgi:hypothetical protein
MTATQPEVGQALTVAERPATTALIRPIATPMALLALHREIAAVISSILQPDIDYGVIPGTGNKPALLKPGAERVCFAFGCSPRYEVVAREIEHDRPVPWTKRKKLWRNQFKGDREFTWQEEAGSSLGLYRYEIRCRLVRREDDAVVAEGLGSCSTMESKYIDRPRDCENTVLKMAQKRALVAAVLNGFGLSDRFTQDVEEFAEPHAEAGETGNRTGARQEHPAGKAGAGPSAVGSQTPSVAPEIGDTTSTSRDNASTGTSLEQACAYILPGKPGAWGGFAGQPLGECRNSVLHAVAKWCRAKYDEEPSDRLGELLQAVVLVIEARDAGEIAEPAKVGDAQEG